MYFIAVDFTDSSAICKIRAFPSSSAEPMITEYLQDDEVLAACSHEASILNCWYLNYGSPPNWQPLATPAHNYRSNETHSHYVSDGWLIFGNNGNSTFSAEILSGKNEKWQQLREFHEDEPFPSLACSVSLDMDNQVLITGGMSRFQSSSAAKILDLDAETLCDVSPMPSDMYGHSCILTESGEVLVAGGRRSNMAMSDLPLHHSYLYNVEEDTWRRIQDLPIPRRPLLFHMNGKTALAAANAKSAKKRSIWTLKGSEWKLLDKYEGIMNYLPKANLLPTNLKIPCVPHN